MALEDLVVTIERRDQGAIREQYVATVEHHFRLGAQIQKEQVSEAPIDAKRLLDAADEINGKIEAALNERGSNPAADIEEFGRYLYHQLFSTAADQDAFKGALASAQGRNTGLRIRLCLPDELRRVPWELIRTVDKPEHFLGVNEALAIVHSDSDAEAMQLDRQVGRLPLQVLVVVSSPLDRAPLNARAEVGRLVMSLEALIRVGRVRLDFVNGPNTRPRMQDLIDANEYQILHFIGHGDEHRGQAFLILEDAHRLGLRMPVTRLWLGLKAVQNQLPRLAILNVCRGAKPERRAPFWSLAGAFLQAGVPAIIAHRRDIADDSAIAFTTQFYDRLIDGRSVDEALTSARSEAILHDEWSLEWHSPVLFLNSASGDLFNVPALATQQLQADAGRQTALATQARDAGRWSEAVDYARTALAIQPENETAGQVYDEALEQETLDSYLHEARFAEHEREWETAYTCYDRFLSSAADAKRPAVELDLAERLRLVASATIGAPDPSLRWETEELTKCRFPYELLSSQFEDDVRQILPSSPQDAVIKGFTPVKRQERAAWDALRKLPSRLKVDFFLYRVSPSKQLAAFADSLRRSRVAPGPNDVAKELAEEDASIVLALMGHRNEARQRLENSDAASPIDTRSVHRLALLSYAEAQQHEKDAEAQQHERDKHVTAAVRAWRDTIAYWVGTLADDRYWEDWCRLRQVRYRAELTAEDREDARRELGRLLGRQISRYSRAADADEEQRALEIGLAVESEGVIALKSAGGLEVDPSRTIACGPLLLEKLELVPGIQKLVAELTKELEHYEGMAAAEALRAKEPRVSAEDLRRLRVAFSDLAPAATLLRLGKPELASQEMPTPLRDPGSASPAYGSLANRLATYRQDAAHLAIETHAQIGLQQIKKAPPNLSAAADEWGKALRRGREADLEAAASETISKHAMGRASSVKGDPTSREPEDDELDQVVNLLETASEVLPQRFADGVSGQLVARRLQRGRQLANRGDFERAMRDLERAFELSPRDASIRAELCHGLIDFAGPLAGNERTLQSAKSRLMRAARLARTGLESDPNDSELMSILREADATLALLEGKDPLDEVLKPKPARDEVERAVRMRMSRDYAGAASILEAVLKEHQDYDFAQDELSRIYEFWTEELLDGPSLNETKEKVRLGRQLGRNPQRFSQLEQQIQAAEDMLGMQDES